MKFETVEAMYTEALRLQDLYDWPVSIAEPSTEKDGKLFLKIFVGPKILTTVFKPTKKQNEPLSYDVFVMTERLARR
jgi:hypothetical protein